MECFDSLVVWYSSGIWLIVKGLGLFRRELNYGIVLTNSSLPLASCSNYQCNVVIFFMLLLWFSNLLARRSQPRHALPTPVIALYARGQCATASPQARRCHAFSIQERHHYTSTSAPEHLLLFFTWGPIPILLTLFPRPFCWLQFPRPLVPKFTTPSTPFVLPVVFLIGCYLPPSRMTIPLINSSFNRRKRKHRLVFGIFFEGEFYFFYLLYSFIIFYSFHFLF